ncbi:MAG: outer membrane protein OmpA-like peptidoglycan-associated protein [Oleispira sp.]|jgi:outer membrane protein OmpA-like peptidoglycan-associated protein
MNLSTNAIKSTDREIDETGAWLSIGDLMSGLLMIFALLLVVTILQLKEGEDQRIVIIQELTDIFKENKLNIEVDKRTGDISILDSVLFDNDSAEMKAQGESFLKQFIPLYSKVLLSSESISKQIRFIVVEGHTSSAGSNAHNMNLSIQRANAVFNAIQDLKYANRKLLMNKLLVAGRGEAEANRARNDSRDRKVVFRIQFSNEQLWARFKTLVKGE